jgi:hypothetical protein
MQLNANLNLKELTCAKKIKDQTKNIKKKIILFQATIIRERVNSASSSVKTPLGLVYIYIYIYIYDFT